MIENLKSQILKFKANQFLSGSLIMVLGFNLYNFGQAVYHFLVARMLGKAQYGDLASIITILGIVAVVQMSVGLTIVKFIASDKNKAKSNFIKWVFIWSIWGAVILGVVAELLSPFLINFLNIAQPLSVYLLGPILFFFFLANANRSILQGLFKFDKYILSLLAESIFKIVLSVGLILAGLAVFGAMVAFLLAIFFSFLVTLGSIKKYLKGKKVQAPEIGPLFKYSQAVLIQGLALTSMYSADLLLVKHFFEASEAGLYASLAIMGRIVFFGTSPITNVMFPMVAKRFGSGQPFHKIFYLSLNLILTIAFFVTAVYIFLPQLAISLLVGKQYLDGAPILWWFGIL